MFHSDRYFSSNEKIVEQKTEKKSQETKSLGICKLLDILKFSKKQSNFEWSKSIIKTPHLTDLGCNNYRNYLLQMDY